VITLAPWGANARDSWPIGPLATLTQFCQRCQSSSVLRWRGLSCAAQNTGKACPDGAAGDGLFGAHPDTGEDTYLMQLSLQGLYAPYGVTEPGVDFLGCVDIDDCLSNPCGVGTCTDTFETDAKANSYTCACPDGLIWDELAPAGGEPVHPHRHLHHRPGVLTRGCGTYHSGQSTTLVALRRLTRAGPMAPTTAPGVLCGHMSPSATGTVLTL
jgi:hypothetical protein